MLIIAGADRLPAFSCFPGTDRSELAARLDEVAAISVDLMPVYGAIEQRLDGDLAASVRALLDRSGALYEEGPGVKG
jgi:hypothetical protein